MCYHTSHPDEKALRKEFKSLGVQYKRDEIFHVSGFARPFLPVTLNSSPEIIREARWKLIPFWVKNEADAAKYANTLNAESESIFEKASYKNYITKNRGLLYVNGFYEPHKVKGVKDTENYYIYHPDKKIFTLGVVYSDFTDQDTGETYPTFSIITTPANPLLGEIHNEKKRMPLIIGEKDRDAWLFADGKDEITDLMVPYNGELGSHQVYRVTGARGEDTNHPDIQKAI
ncbi:SOS response-associated peptidase [Sphingobacterium sp. DK4209]|uniref:Abasic site processing protein n=1 Tax=Sphingobacterium zhuxiongii TaxID=2662364 RepID=A0A5Q0Q8F2_9SPHI|nr:MULTISPECIES: SOS response-associated peptidase family protein [unclassified Sphingobacterium]MVZ67418.1 SOS response-associated peptidase [Sphingobacterium sp. DK4209]QGA25389.1 SOS response-associated peptidase [Sphingobacterium sp. dk4302]